MSLEMKQLKSNNFKISIEISCSNITPHLTSEWTETSVQLTSEWTEMSVQFQDNRFTYEKSLLDLPVNKIFTLYKSNQLGCVECAEIDSHFSNYRQFMDTIKWFHFANDYVLKDYEKRVYQIISSQIDDQPPGDVRFHANLYHRLIDSAIQVWNGKLISEDISRGTGLNTSVVRDYVDRLIESKLTEKTKDNRLHWIAQSEYYRSFSPNALKAIMARAKILKERREKSRT
jgi:hypothetical protein